MPGNSRRVSSSQQSLHSRLAEVVERHLASTDQRPPADHSIAAFEAVREWAETGDGDLVLDSFCGTGMSTLQLAARHTGCKVIGIDQSASRLARHAPGPGEYRLVRADCGDFWRLALAAGWQLKAHYLLYPNPWPKPGQLQRRIHGAPEFSALLALGGRVELRSNWQLYVEEFGTALNIAGHTPVIQQLEAVEPLTLHERKYSRSDHELWRCICQLGHNRRP